MCQSPPAAPARPAAPRAEAEAHQAGKAKRFPLTLRASDKNAVQRTPTPVPLISRLRRAGLTLTLLAATGIAGAAPASAVEVLLLRLPLLEDRLSARVSELSSPDSLWAGSSDLAELNRATDGHFAGAIQDLVNYPLPQQDFQNSPMVQQIEVLLKQLIEVDGGGADIGNEPVRGALGRLKASGQQATLLNLLREVPGQRVTIRLDRAVPMLRRFKGQQLELDQLLLSLPKLPGASGANLAQGPFAVQSRVVTLPEPYTHESIEVTTVLPAGAPTLAPVVISHGLWDSPTSFLGWARFLASHGAPVFLPRHPGSDISQQADMLAGRSAPPDPKEFLRRPLDVRAVLDALDAGGVPGAESIRARGVTFIGHSWGGTTALQLAGARSVPAPLWKDCARAGSPLRNISWVLQCSFLPAATDSSMADPRVVRVAAISPPQALVFAAGLNSLRVPVLVVSGSRDFVVPSRPEALLPFGDYPKGHNALVVAEGGTHFNLPADAASNGGPLRALLLRWARDQDLSATSAVADPQGLPMRWVPLRPVHR